LGQRQHSIVQAGDLPTPDGRHIRLCQVSQHCRRGQEISISGRCGSDGGSTVVVSGACIEVK
jgi:hypothetical protein